MGDPRQTPVVVVWFRGDFRLADHLALTAAVQSRQPIIPLYIHSPEEDGAWSRGGASRWWLHHSLTALSQSLAEKGSRLIIRQGPATEVLSHLFRELPVEAVYFQSRVEPAARAVEAALAKQFNSSQLKAFDGNVLYPPGQVKNNAGEPFKVFTPFWKNILQQETPHEPSPAPSQLPTPTVMPEGLTVEDLGLLPTIPWDRQFYCHWQPGEVGAQKALERFLEQAVLTYGTDRERPDYSGTSRLSPHLHFGEISLSQVWHTVQQTMQQNADSGLKTNALGFLREVAWREFAHHILYFFPHTPTAPFRKDFEAFPFEVPTEAVLKAWQQGQTGYPIVDAGMRELWATGWMHNRVRMVVASFLVKHLLISWQYGAAWFWETLVDADLANNTLGWQWSAGCGVDAAPYFRIFNPMLQGAKFDPNGDYVRRWVPELSQCPASVIHSPWEAKPLVLHQAGVVLGRTYPRPIVEHTEARDRALMAFKSLKTPI